MIYLQLFYTFFQRSGSFGFGGGYAMLSIQGEVVTPLWMGEFAGVHGYCHQISQMTPGPIGINLQLLM